MPANPRPESIDAPAPEPSDLPEIAAYETRPGNNVFLESGNTDAWISTDVVVEPRL